MKTLSVITEESLQAIMDEVDNEFAKLTAKLSSKEERIAFSVFFGTMTKIMLDITEGMGLSDEEQEDILTVCGTYFIIGMLAGKSPPLLLAILKKAKPGIEKFTPPEWVGEKARAIAAVEKLLRRKSGEQ